MRARCHITSFCFAFFAGLAAVCQPVGKEALSSYQTWPRFQSIQSFYAAHNQQFAWLGKPRQQQDLLQLLQRAHSFGLDINEFQFAYLKTYKPGQALQTAKDSVDADVRLTDAAIHFISDIKKGSPPSFGYTGLNYQPDVSTLPAELKAQMEKGNLLDLAIHFQPRSKEYAIALGMLNWFQQVSAQPGFQDARIISAKADSTNKPLLLRLYQLAITDSFNLQIKKPELGACIKKAQEMFDLQSDGLLRSNLLKALNVPLQQRIDELKSLLSTLRWLEDLKQTSALLVNIPSASLLIYEKGTIVLDSRVIVGKKATPTPTLTSTITEVILYPYWMVPYSIATKELLPAAKRNPGYLERGNYQVLNKKGQVINPYKINWHALSTSNFPYIIRQGTGCDNALGIVKFNFYNPYTVYLHDTPNKSLFKNNRRFYSHGCMRVEKPTELARYLLGRNHRAIDTLTAKGCIYQAAPKSVRAERQLPVLVLYSTVWYNKAGEIRFYEDVYNRRPGQALKQSAMVLHSTAIAD